MQRFLWQCLTILAFTSSFTIAHRSPYSSDLLLEIFSIPDTNSLNCELLVFDDIELPIDAISLGREKADILNNKEQIEFWLKKFQHEKHGLFYARIVDPVTHIIVATACDDSPVQSRELHLYLKPVVKRN